MNISFSATTEQVRDRTKTVTRRLGWGLLKAGQVLTAIEKGQGLKKGEKVKPICKIRVKSNKPESLNSLTSLLSAPDCWTDAHREMKREGFPYLTPSEFVKMFCKLNGCKPDTIVNRIEFEYLD